jgi:hypothetical protein
MLEKLKQLAEKTQKMLSSMDKTLWLWAAVTAAGLLLFYLLIGIPGRGTTLVFAQWWEDDLEAGVLESLVNDFEEQYPGVKIQLEKKKPRGNRGGAFRRG